MESAWYGKENVKCGEVWRFEFGLTCGVWGVESDCGVECRLWSGQCVECRALSGE